MAEKNEEKKETGVPAQQRSEVSAGGIGFALAVIGLLCFWVPVIGVGFWFLGLLFSFAGIFAASRGFAISGLAVSAIACGFILFLAQGEPFEHVLAEAKSLFRAEVVDGAYVRPEGAKHEVAVPAETVVSAHTAAVSPSRAETPSDGSFSSDDETPAVPVSGASGVRRVAEPVAGEFFPPFPVSRFEEISRKRGTWPKFVRLTRARKITLWDDDSKEIMGKMEIPAGSVVEVLAVRSDGALEALDCTGQRFQILAADTNFAEMWILRNEN